MARKLRVKVNDRWYTVEVGDLDANPVRVLVDGEPVEVDLEQPLAVEAPRPVTAGADPASAARAPVAGRPSAVKAFHSPMSGVIVSVSVREGQQVVTGDQVCVLEAMKMQQVLRADWSGIVKTVHVQPGQQVDQGELLIELA